MGGKYGSVIYGYNLKLPPFVRKYQAIIPNLIGYFYAFLLIFLSYAHLFYYISVHWQTSGSRCKRFKKDLRDKF